MARKPARRGYDRPTVDDAAEPKPRSTADLIADVCVYAPIGLLFGATKYVPELAEKGRSQVAVARFIGQFAMGRLSKQLEPVLGGVAGPLKVICDGLGLTPPATAPTQAEGPAAAAAPGAAPSNGRADGVAGMGDGDGGRVEAEADADTIFDVDPPTEGELAIPGYSALAASQVVPRLASLNIHELAAIRRFESATRARRTILNRVDQLLARAS